MNIVETLLIFAGIPLGLSLVLFACVYGPTLLHQSSRYRPGRPWTYDPVWYVPHPEHLGLISQSPAELTSSPGQPIMFGGASGEW